MPSFDLKNDTPPPPRSLHRAPPPSPPCMNGWCTPPQLHPPPPLRTLEMWTPRLRWKPEQRRQMKTPKLMLAHRGAAGHEEGPTPTREEETPWAGSLGGSSLICPLRWVKTMAGGTARGRRGEIK